MKTRVISGIVIAAVSVAFLAISGIFPIALNIFLMFIAMAGVYEILKMTKLNRHIVVFVSSILTSAAIFLPFLSGRTFSVFYPYFVIICICMLYLNKTVDYKDFMLLIVFCTVVPYSLLTLVTTRDSAGEHGVFCFAMAVLTAWAADIGAYFAGTLFGKHKLCPDISPKKTVEGAIGGMIFNTAIMLILGFLYSTLLFDGSIKINYAALFLIGFLGAPVSIIGDLTFSLIKRRYRIKDFGDLIPGHGGILDRFDSVIFTAPFTMLVFEYLPLV